MTRQTAHTTPHERTNRRKPPDRAWHARVSRMLAVIIGVVLLASMCLAVSTPAGATDDPAGIVATWGSNFNGQLGDSTKTDSSIPVTVFGPLATIVPSTLTTGDDHTCAIAQGKPYCWGFNLYGQLGNNTTTLSSVPVAVNTAGALHNKIITAITAGDEHTCVIADGKPYCWGFNLYGQLGNNTTTSSTVPVAVNTAGVLHNKTITTITAGDNHTCVIADGKPYCWGHNNVDQLGNNNTTADSPLPVAVTTTGVLNRATTAIDAGDNHTCVIADGKPYCWGYNEYGQLGNNTTTNGPLPVAVTTTGALSNKATTDIAAGGNHTCAIADGKPYCWGYNPYGQLGDNTTTNSHVPVAVTTRGVLTNKSITAVDAGDYHSCAIADGKPYCWGNNGHGQLGNSTTVDSHVPVAVNTGGTLHSRVTIELGANGADSAALAMDDPGFCDVTSSAAFYTDIVWLSGVGVSTGSGGCYQPAAPVSRQAMAAFLYRALNPGAADPACTGTTRTFTDVPTSHPFCGPIEWLAGKGIAGGYPDGTYRPTAPVTRQAMAAFMYRALTPDSPDLTCSPFAIRSFADVPATNAFCGPIEWLALTGIAGGYPDGSYRPTGNVSRQAMAAFVHRAFT